MKKVHIFDLDGTLADSMRAWTDGTVKLLDEAGIGNKDEIIRAITPLGAKGAAEYLIKIGIKGTAEELLRSIEENMIYQYSYVIRLKRGAETYIKELWDKGDRLFVLTASPHRTTDVCLKNNGVFDLFERVFTIDDFGLFKSDTRIYDEAAERIGIKNDEITFYDDNIIALEAAKKAGLHVVGVYDASSEGDADKIKKITEKYLVWD